MKKSPFANLKLDNNNIEKIAWRRLSIKERLERGLDWGHEIEYIHQKLFGKAKKLSKLQEDLRTQKANRQAGK